MIRVSASELAQVMEQDHRALDAFAKGDPEPKKKLFSRREDVTLANPLGPPARGWKEVEKTLERAASQLREGEAIGFERISDYATADLAYIVEIERYRAKVGGADDVEPISLRVTTIFRREDDGWKIVHRHADPITSPRPAESVVQR
jgi:ketosteroid isomerase-like protein